MISDFEAKYDTGAAGSIMVISEYLVKNGHDVNIVWRENKRNIKAYNLFRNIELPFIQYSQLKNAFLEKKFDVVFISQPFCWLAFKVLKKKYPDVIFLNRTHGWELRIEPLMWGKTKKSFLGFVRNLITKIMLKINSYLTIKYSDGIICASSSDSDFLKMTYSKYNNKVHLINYGLSNEFINVDLNLKEKSNIINFLYVGQYCERKGVYDLLEIFKKKPYNSKFFKLTFIVEEEKVDEVKNDFEFLGDALIVMSWLSRKDLIKHYINNDIFLFPSYGEGFGKTTIEAMSCGLCVLGYNEGALKDLCRNQYTALLAEPGNIKELDLNIEFVFNNINFCRTIGLNAYNSIQELTWDNYVTNTMNLIAKLKF